MISSSAITIAKLPSDEGAALRPLLQKCWAQTYADEQGKLVTAKLIETLGSDDIGGLVPITDETVFVATQDHHIIGCTVSAARHGVTYIWGCYVLREFQRKGIGSKLLRQAVLAHGKANMVQLTVLRSSLEAVKFYQALGFVIQSEGCFDLLPGHRLPSITMNAAAADIV